MKRSLAIALGLLLAAVIVAGGALALWPAEPAGPVYTVAEITAGLRQHPGWWAGRTVAVRGVFVDYGVSLSPSSASSWSAFVLSDPVSLTGRPPQRSPWFVTGQGLRVRLNAPGTAPTLLLRGVGPPRPTLLDRARQVVTQLAAHLGPARRTNAYGPGPPQPRVYRVQLLAPARCPAPLVAPCYTAVVR